jgi:hypothetical protein
MKSGKRIFELNKAKCRAVEETLFKLSFFIFGRKALGFID